MKTSRKIKKPKEPALTVLEDEVQLTIVDVPLTERRKKIALLPIDLESPTQQELFKLESKYREVFDRRLDWCIKSNSTCVDRIRIQNWESDEN